MRRPTQWFQTKAQQGVMMRTSILPVIARTGPSSRRTKTTVTKKSGEGTFIVGESEVGGPDRVGGTP